MESSGFISAELESIMMYFYGKVMVSIDQVHVSAGTKLKVRTCQPIIPPTWLFHLMLVSGAAFYNWHPKWNYLDLPSFLPL